MQGEEQELQTFPDLGRVVNVFKSHRTIVLNSIFHVIEDESVEWI